MNEKQIGKRKNFKSLYVRNIPNSIWAKMNKKREEEQISFSDQIRTALRFWFDIF